MTVSPESRATALRPRNLPGSGAVRPSCRIHAARLPRPCLGRQRPGLGGAGQSAGGMARLPPLLGLGICRERQDAGAAASLVEPLPAGPTMLRLLPLKELVARLSCLCRPAPPAVEAAMAVAGTATDCVCGLALLAAGPLPWWLQHALTLEQLPAPVWQRPRQLSGEPPWALARTPLGAACLEAASGERRLRLGLPDGLAQCLGLPCRVWQGSLQRGF